MSRDGYLLSEKQRRVLLLVAEGWSNEKIGFLLNITSHTVSNHMMNISHKLGTTNRTHSVVMALRRTEIML